MKVLIQTVLFFSIILISIFFYNTYFLKEDILSIINLKSEKLEIKSDVQTPKLEEKKSLTTETKNTLNTETKQKKNTSNLIQNLKYKVKLQDQKEYEIIANSSELTYKNNAEIILMSDVRANFIDQDNRIIKINSDKAIFNNSSYNTQFEKNVKIEYLGNIITSNSLSYNFEKSEILIREKVTYKGIHGEITADNILINILSKDIKVFMNNSDNKINMKSY